MAKMMTSKTLAEGGQDLETVDKAANTVALVKPRYGNTFKSIPLIAKEKAENNMFQPFVTEAELLKYIPILVPTVAKALDTHKVWFYGLDPNVTEVDQKPKWHDTGLSELEQAKEYSDTTVNPHLDLDRFLDKNGFVFAEFVDAIFEFYISLRTANIHTDNIVNSQVVNIDSPKFDVANLSLDVSEHGLIIKDGSGFFFSLEDILQHVDRINQLFNQANSIRKTVDTSKPLFGKKLVFWKNEKLTIDVSNLLFDRIEQSENGYVLATLSAINSSFTTTSSRQLHVPSFDQLGSKSHLILRDKIDQINRSRLIIDSISIDDAIEQNEIKVHLIGDSILNRGGGFLIDEYLNNHGYKSKYIGTMLGTNNSENANGENGKLGEAREGWESGDFTYKVVDRVKIINVGSEQDYLNFDKSTKWTYNPYLRLATDQDDAAIVNNGYVFDFSFYLKRFNLEEPQVVYIGLGTNDIRDLDEPKLSEEFYLNIMLMIKQIKLAVPTCKIIISIPGTAYDVARNSLWKSEYVPIIRTLQKISNETGVTLAPVWALNSQEDGYALKTVSVDDVSGAALCVLSDAIHQSNATRRSTYNVIAAYIAAASLNLI